MEVKDIDIGADIMQDIRTMTSDSAMQGVYTDVAETVERVLDRINQSGANPDGSQRQPLSSFYAQEKSNKGLNDYSDFKFSGKAERSLDYSTNNRGIEFSYKNSEANEYMYDHEYGMNGMPQRRLFPVSEGDTRSGVSDDMSSSYGKQITAEVERTLEDHLNQDRVIRG